MTAPNLDQFLGKPKARRGRLFKWGAIVIGVLLVLLLLSRCFAPPKPPNYATAPGLRLAQELVEVGGGHDVDPIVSGAAGCQPPPSAR